MVGGRRMVVKQNASETTRSLVTCTLVDGE